MQKPKVFIMGHSHIDAEWLWTRDETLKVCRYTFRNVLELMEKYPDLTFVQSSAHYYLWVEDSEIFEAIKARVAEGRWEPALPWVEFDANMPHGEALARHLIYSKRYFKEKFGLDVKILWLPDTFGFPATLPQIMKEAEVHYFLTQKMLWNDTTLFPYNYFWWEAPDGSRVLAHQTLGGYGGYADEGQVDFALRVSEFRHGFPAVLVMIGHGDHGGGLNRDMVESGERIIASGKYDAAFSTPTRFFEWLDKLARERSLPVWRDELYLEYHRGTYTTQSRFKRLHRMAEQLLLSAERLAAAASMYGYEYPAGALDKLWVTLLFNQFHDILAGSSIPEVYENAERDLRLVVEEAERLARQAASHVLKLAKVKRGEDIVFNTLPWRRRAHVELPDGRSMTVDLPALGYRPVEEAATGQVKLVKEGSKITVRNEYFEAVIDEETGALISLKASGRELIDADRGGVHVQVFRDEPVQGRKTLVFNFDAVVFDAWEIYIFQQPEGVVRDDLLRPEEVTVLAGGPGKAAVCVTYRYVQAGRPDSMFKVVYEAYAGIPWLTIRFRVDWKAKHRFAKLFIPLSYYSEFAYYDQAYGWVKRRTPLSPNATLSERAKWEVPGHMWVYVPGGEAGLAVLDDGKYGYDFGGDFIRVSLLRSARYPDPWGRKWEGEPPITDQGVHEFSIALLPSDDSSLTEIVRRAYEFNNKPILLAASSDGTGELPRTCSLLEVEGGVGVVFKRADQGDGYIVRLYNVEEKPVKAQVRLPLEIGRAKLVNFLEREKGDARIDGSTAVLELAPFKIATLRLELSKR